MSACPTCAPTAASDTTFCLATGRGVVHYWFRAVTLYETNYPYKRGSLSNRSRVTGRPAERATSCLPARSTPHGAKAHDSTIQQSSARVRRHPGCGRVRRGRVAGASVGRHVRARRVLPVHDQQRRVPARGRVRDRRVLELHGGRHSGGDLPGECHQRDGAVDRAEQGLGRYARLLVHARAKRPEDRRRDYPTIRDGKPAGERRERVGWRFFLGQRRCRNSRQRVRLRLVHEQLNLRLADRLRLEHVRRQRARGASSGHSDSSVYRGDHGPIDHGDLPSSIARRAGFAATAGRSASRPTIRAAYATRRQPWVPQCFRARPQARITRSITSAR